MNRERLLRLADVIERGAIEGVKFDMAHWINDCGTAACIAGHAYMIMPECERDADEIGFRGYISYSAALWLDLTEQQAYELFSPADESDVIGGMAYAQIGPAMAARSIRILVETGRVDWKRARREHVMACQAARKLENA